MTKDEISKNESRTKFEGGMTQTWVTRGVRRIFVSNFPLRPSNLIRVFEISSFGFTSRPGDYNASGRTTTRSTKWEIEPPLGLLSLLAAAAACLRLIAARRSAPLQSPLARNSK
jgi:hypothetical protein